MTLRIALVEDNPADAQMLRAALRQNAEVEITLLEDGLKALEYLTSNHAPQAPRPCDLVLLDLNLPMIGGIEVLEEIRARPELRSLPVIVMSGSVDPLEINRCYLAGANSFICKPVHLDDIFAVAAQFMNYWSRCVQLPSRRPMERPVEHPIGGVCEPGKCGEEGPPERYSSKSVTKTPSNSQLS